MTHNVFRDGMVHVCERKCSTCIYRPGNLMYLEEGRVEDMEQKAIKGGSTIVCHKTLDGDNAACRGFWDVHRDKVPALQIAGRVGLVVYDDPDKEK